MNETIQDAVIEEYLKGLKMPAIARSYQTISRHAGEEGWRYQDYLKELLEVEMLARQQHSAERLLREAGFPDIKRLEQIDWTAVEGIGRAKIMELASCQWIERAED